MWSSQDDPFCSDLFLRAVGFRFILSEFYEHGGQPLSEAGQDGLRYFQQLAGQIHDVVQRTLSRVDETVENSLGETLRAENAGWPTHPWLGLVYDVTLGLRTPGSLADIEIETIEGTDLKTGTYVDDPSTGERRHLSDRGDVQKVFLKPPQGWRGRRVTFTIVGAKSVEFNSPREFADSLSRLDPKVPHQIPTCVALRSDPFSASWSVLDVICQWLEEVPTEIRQSVSVPDCKDEPMSSVHDIGEDGPVDSLDDSRKHGRFRWKGKEDLVKGKNWQLLCCLWDKDSVAFSEVGEEVWDNDLTNPSTIRSAVVRLNDALANLWPGIDVYWECPSESVRRIRPEDECAANLLQELQPPCSD